MTFTRPGTKTASSTESTATTSASTPRTWAATRRRWASPMTTGRQSSAISGSTRAPTTTSGPTPALNMVHPRGAQRGDEVEITLSGTRLADAQEVLVYQPGITVTDVKPEGANAV